MLVAVSAEAQHDRVFLHSFDVFHADRQVEVVLFGFKWFEQSINMLCFSSLQFTVRVLNVENSEVIILLVEHFKGF